MDGSWDEFPLVEASTGGDDPWAEFPLAGKAPKLDAPETARLTERKSPLWDDGEFPLAQPAPLPAPEPAAVAPEPEGVSLDPDPAAGAFVPQISPTEKARMDAEPPGALKRGWMGGLVGDNPKLAGEAMEAVGELTGSEMLKSSGADLSAKGKEWGKPYEPRVKSIADIGGVDDFFTWLGESVGRGTASSVPSAVAGVGVGLATANPVIGVLGGAAAPSYIQSLGDVYSSLKEDEGVAAKLAAGEMNRKTLAGAAALAAVPMAALDAASILKITGPITGAAKAALKDSVIKWAAKHVAGGAVVEGATEGLQETISQWAQAHMDETAFATAKRMMAIIDSVAAGIATGGAMSSATALAGKPGEAPVAEPEMERQAPPPLRVEVSPAPEAEASAEPSPVVTTPAGDPPVPGYTPFLDSDGTQIGWQSPDGAHVIALERKPAPPVTRDALRQALDASDSGASAAPAMQPPSANANEPVINRETLAKAIEEPAEPENEEAPERRPVFELEQEVEDLEGRLGNPRLTQFERNGIETQIEALREEIDERRGAAEPGDAYQADLFAESELSPPEPGTRAAPVRIESAADAHEAALQAEAAPSDGQKEAGNYRKGHARIHGLEISIENPKGSERSGKTPDGGTWSVEMPAHYGYIRRTEGNDGDQVDVYIGDAPEAKTAFVVDQIDPGTGKFDEHKVMLGFTDRDDAIAHYDASFSDGSGRSRRGEVTEMPLTQLKRWVRNGVRNRPFAWQPKKEPPPAPNPPIVRSPYFGDIDLRLPDEAHADMASYGAHLQQGGRPDPARRKGIFEAFRGFPVIDGMRTEKEVDQAAWEYALGLKESAADWAIANGQKQADGWLIIDPDEQLRYVRERRPEMFSLRQGDGNPAPLAAKLTGDELGRHDTFPQLRSAAIAYGLDRLRGLSVVNKAKGWTIRISGKGIKEAAQGNDADVLRLIPAIPAMLEHGVYEGPQPDRKKRPEIKAVHTFRSAVEVAGRRIETILTVRETRQGQFFYDLEKDDGRGSAGAERSKAPQVRYQLGEPAAGTLNIGIVGAPGKAGASVSEPAGNVPTAPWRLTAADRKVLARLREQLDRYGLQDVAVALVEKIDAYIDGRLEKADASYLDRLIKVAHDARDKPAKLDHEVVHAMIELGLLREEMPFLRNRARLEWRERFEIDQDYAGKSEAVKVEEAIAHGLGEVLSGARNAGGVFARAVRKVKNFLEALGSWLRGEGFTSLGSIADKIASGKVGVRKRQPRKARQEEMFSLRDGERLAARLDDAEASAEPAMTLRKARAILGDKGRASLVPVADVNWLTKKVVHPRTIASLYKNFAPLYRAAVRMIDDREGIARSLGLLLEPYYKLGPEDKQAVNAVLERERLTGNRAEGSIIPSGRDGKGPPLTAEQLGGYRAVRWTMDEALDIYRDRFLEAQGLPVGITVGQVRDRAKEDPELARDAEWIISVLDAVEKARKEGYVPFTRYGRWAIAVRDSHGALVHFEKMEDPPGHKIPVLGRAMSALARQKADIRRAELMRQYPKARGYTVGPWNQTTVEQVLREADVSLGDLDMMAHLGNVAEEDYAKVRGAVESALKRRGFQKHFIGSQNTPGYSTDFERSLADYIVGISGYLARRKAKPEIDGALAGLGLVHSVDTGDKKMATKQPELLAYARDYIDYVMSPEEEWQTARQLTFFMYLAGNVSSAVVNLSQVPLVTAPYLAMFANPGRVSLELNRAYKDAMTMLSTKKGLELFDPAKAPADVRADLLKAVERGDLLPLQTIEQTAIAAGGHPALRRMGKGWRNTMEISASIFTAAERVNRVVTYIAAHRIARLPDAARKISEVLAKDALWREELGEVGGSLDPDIFARFAIDETHFKMGKVNRPEAMRGVGSWILQFKGFMLQMLELQYRLVTGRHGRRGYGALAAMGLAMMVTAGMFGLPGADDLKNLIEALHRFFKDRDIDLETELRELLAERGAPAWLTEALARGFARQTGVDVSKRIGMGDIVPDDLQDAGGMPIEITFGRGMRAAQALKRGDHALAASEALPQFLRNPVQAWWWSQHGVPAQATGRTRIPKEKVSAGDVVAKAVGFTSSKIARQREAEHAVGRMRKSVAETRQAFYTRMAREQAALIRSTDEAEKREVQKRIDGILGEIKAFNEGGEAHEQIKLDRAHLQNLVRQELQGTEASKGPKATRGRAERVREVYGVR